MLWLAIYTRWLPTPVIFSWICFNSLTEGHYLKFSRYASSVGINYVWVSYELIVSYCKIE